jgi:hypothetical protein
LWEEISRLDEAMFESFPASDPPSWNGGLSAEPARVDGDAMQTRIENDSMGAVSVGTGLNRHPDFPARSVRSVRSACPPRSRAAASCPAR